MLRIITEPARKVLSKLKNGIIYGLYDKGAIDDKMAIFTSRNGADLAGNMFRLLIELCRQKGSEEKIYVAARPAKKEAIRRMLDQYDLRQVQTVPYNSIRYYRYLERAKYVFCDATLPNKYIKRDGQVYINTWHGTPLKFMGNDSRSDRYNVGNVQKNLICADYFIVPNDYYKETMFRAYGLDGLFRGNAVCSGYPRNEIFYDDEKRRGIIEKYHLENKKIYVYMPTFRESHGARQNKKQNAVIRDMLNVLDQALSDDEILYVKLHIFNASQIDCSNYKRIRQFPTTEETYEFLNAADCLITDYSSVMYDYANTRRKIIRYVYDEEHYFENRGFYDQPVEMPFPKVYTAQELASELQRDKTYNDSEFCACFCQYDNDSASKKIIDEIFSGTAADRGKETGNVLLYDETLEPGFWQSRLDRLIREEYHDSRCYIGFCKEKIQFKTENFENMSEQAISTIGLLAPNKTIGETLAVRLYRWHGMRNRWVMHQVNKLYRREAYRQLNFYQFDEYALYQGFDFDAVNTLAYADGYKKLYLFYSFVNRIDTDTLQRCIKRFDEIILADTEMADYLERIGVKIQGVKTTVLRT